MTRTRLENMGFDVMVSNLGIMWDRDPEVEGKKRSGGVGKRRTRGLAYQQEMCCRVTISYRRLRFTRMEEQISLKGGTA